MMYMYIYNVYTCTHVYTNHRVQSFRRSMRRSFRGRARTTSSSSAAAFSSDASNDRKKIAQTLNLGAGVRERGGGARSGRGAGRPRINSEPISSRFEHSQSPPPSAAEQVPPEMMGVVSHLLFAETYVSGQ